MHDALVDARALSKLRWRCRRGLLENDLFIERFFDRYAIGLLESQAQGLLALMDLADNDLLDLLLGRTQPEGELANPQVLTVLAQMRVPALPSSGHPKGASFDFSIQRNDL
jgi:antitoxin CptB